MKVATRWLTWSASLFKVRLPESYVRVGTAAAAAFNLFGFPLELITWRGVVPRWPEYLSMAVGMGILFYIGSDKKRLRTRWLPSFFVVNATFVSFALVILHSYVWYSKHPTVPFQATKLGAIVAGVLAPNLLSGLLAIGIHVGSSATQFVLFPPEIRTLSSTEEPWATLAFGLAALLIVVYRMRIRKRELEANEAQLRAEHTRRMAQVFLELRDLMNTPLQSIEIGVALLGEENEERRAILLQLRASCDQLRKLNQILKQYEDRSR